MCDRIYPEIFLVLGVYMVDVRFYVTVREASQIYHRSIATIKEHITNGNLAAQKIGRDLLVSIESLNDFYGYPWGDDFVKVVSERKIYPRKDSA